MKPQLNAAVAYLRIVGLENYTPQGFQDFCTQNQYEDMQPYADATSLLEDLFAHMNQDVMIQCRGSLGDNPPDNLLEILMNRCEWMQPYKDVLKQMFSFLQHHPRTSLVIFNHQRTLIGTILQTAGYTMDSMTMQAKQLYLQAELVRLWHWWCQEEIVPEDKLLAKTAQIIQDFEVFPENLYKKIGAA